MKNQKLANHILAKNPEAEVVYITEDGQAFLTKLKAQNHSNYRKFKKEPEAFFREGFEPKDETELEQALEAAVTKTEEQATLLERISTACDLETPAEEVTDATPEPLVKVLELREVLQRTNDENESLLKELETLRGAEVITENADAGQDTSKEKNQPKKK